jgi:ParB family transcriptional regulator, chromosome partitioning protein
MENIPARGRPPGLTGRHPAGAVRPCRAGAPFRPGSRKTSLAVVSRPAKHTQEAVLTTIATDTIPTSADDDSQGEPQYPDLRPGPAELGPESGEHQAAVFTERPMIPVALLTAHPGNVREDKQADQAFCQSVAAAGILVPLEITTSPGGDGYVVVDGNIRLDAAIKTGLDAVPYVFSPDTADDAGLQYLHMLISSRFRRDLNVYEEASALFSASEAGMTRTQIRKATGLKAAEVRAGILAGGLSPEARETAEKADYEWDLEELALLSPFEDDPEAMDQILKGISYGSSVRYMVQRITDERAARERKAQLAASLEASGVTILGQVPAGAVPLRLLLADSAPGEDHEQADDDRDESDVSDDDPDARREELPELDPEAHAGCPGAAAFFAAYQDDPVWYCLDPDAHGHGRRYPVLARRLPDPLPGGEAPDGDNSPAEDDDARKHRMLVIEGNKAGPRPAPSASSG